ncbi:MAG: phage head-tail connector protein [Melioribacteraceae bacterium]|nr:phage head-tail connector protein [Melioribacteraceae bacterium]
MFISVAEIKQRLGISADDKSKDSSIQSLIAEFEDFIKTECNNQFKDENGNQKFPKSFVTVAVEYVGKNLEPKRMKGVQSESLGDHSISFSVEVFSKTSQQILNKHRKVKW